MKCSAWLIIELGRGNQPRITRVRQSRPRNEMAVHLTLDIDPNTLQPHVEALVEAGMIQLEIEEIDELADTE